MADNIGYTPGTGAIVAADEISGVLYQRVKIAIGADGTATDASAANPVPVTAASFPLPTGAATETTLAAMNTKVPPLGQAAMGACVPVAIAVNQSAVPVTALSLPLPTGAATSTIQTDGTQRTRVTDGTNVAAVKAASTAPLTTDPSLVVTVSPNSPQSLVDNAAFTDGTSRVTPIGYVFDEVAGAALTENDVAAARVDSKRAQVLVIEDETTRGRRATVKAPSIAPGGADTALVVGLSPNGNQATETTVNDIKIRLRQNEQPIDASLAINPARQRSYSICTPRFNPPQDITDVFQIRAGSRPIFVTRLWLTGWRENDATFARVAVVKRSNFSTGGETGIDEFVKHYSDDSNAGAVVEYFASTPGSVGTEVGKVWHGYLTFPTNTQTTFVPPVIYTWEWESVSAKKPIRILNNTDEALTISFVGACPSGMEIICGVEFYEI